MIPRNKDVKGRIMWELEGLCIKCTYHLLDSLPNCLANVLIAPVHIMNTRYDGIAGWYPDIAAKDLQRSGAGTMIF